MFNSRVRKLKCLGRRLTTSGMCIGLVGALPATPSQTSRMLSAAAMPAGTKAPNVQSAAKPAAIPSVKSEAKPHLTAAECAKSLSTRCRVLESQ
jgi:hypothetical protein